MALMVNLASNARAAEALLEGFLEEAMARLGFASLARSVDPCAPRGGVFFGSSELTRWSASRENRERSPLSVLLWRR